MWARRTVGLGVLATFAAAFVATPEAPTAAQGATQPNIVVIYTDDQTMDMMSALPQTEALIGDRGLTFTNSVVSYPLCCPSRASLLTGQYTQNNGVRTNNGIFDGNPLPREDAPTVDVEAYPAFQAEAEARSIAVALESSGYHTGMLGKYLNGYRDTVRIPPGWTDWRALVASGGGPAGGALDYFSTRLRQGDQVETFEGIHQTDLYADQAVDMVGSASSTGEPFFLLFSFSAPHGSSEGPTWAERHDAAFPDALAPRPASFNEADTRDKPDFLRRRYRLLSDDKIAAIDQRWRAALRSLLSLDEAVARIVGELEAADELEDTLLVFTSDNGEYFGEHRVQARKYLPYEPALRVPLIIAGPALAPAVRGTSTDAPVVNVDLAATILDVAGVAPMAPLDGRSLVPLLDGSTGAWQGPGGLWNPGPARIRPIYIMGVQHRPSSLPTYSGVRSGDGWVYVHWEVRGGRNELYDLTTDPDQLDNRAGDPDVASVQARLERQRRLLVRCAGPSCDVPPYGYLDLPARATQPGWFASAQWAEAAGLGVGFSDGTLRARTGLTRLHALLWLWRAAGSPVVEGDDVFEDIRPAAADAARWAQSIGVLPGDGPRFRPAKRLTRANFARWLWVANGRPGGNLAPRPVDVGSSTPAAQAIRWLLTDPDGPGPAAAPATGFADGRFKPAVTVPRSQALAWIHSIYATG